MTNVDEVIESIEVRLITTDEWTHVVLNSDNEAVKSFSWEEQEAAEKFFASLLTPAQVNALQIRADLWNEECAEAAANRVLGYCN